MHQEWHVGILCRPPQALVDGMPVGPVRQRRNRDENPDEPQLLAPFELLASFIDIVDIEHADALQTLRIWFAEIGDPVVIGATNRRQQLAVRDAVPEEALARLQARPPDAILFILFDHCVRIVATLAHILPDPEKIDLRGIFKTLPSLHDRAQGADLHAVDDPGVVLSAGRCCPPLHLWRAVAEFGRDAARIHVRRLNDVRIRRDQLVLRHLRPPPMIFPGPQKSLCPTISRAQTVCRDENESSERRRQP